MKNIFLYSIIFNLFFWGCSSGDDAEIDCFPKYSINVTINLDFPQYQSLNSVGGWVYISTELSGSKGLIVVRSGQNTFKCYDRNAPHICPGTNTTLEVVDNFYILCPADKAKWILTTGAPVEVATIAPKTYYNSFNEASNTLIITN